LEEMAKPKTKEKKVKMDVKEDKNEENQKAEE